MLPTTPTSKTAFSYTEQEIELQKIEDSQRLLIPDSDSSAESTVGPSCWSRTVAWLKGEIPVMPLHTSFSIGGPFGSSMGLSRAGKGFAKWSVTRIGLSSISTTMGVFLLGLLVYETYKKLKSPPRERLEYCASMNTSRWKFGMSILSSMAGVTTIFLP